MCTVDMDVMIASCMQLHHRIIRYVWIQFNFGTDQFTIFIKSNAPIITIQSSNVTVITSKLFHLSFCPSFANGNSTVNGTTCTLGSTRRYFWCNIRQLDDTSMLLHPTKFKHIKNRFQYR
eukprot:233886_1